MKQAAVAKSPAGRPGDDAARRATGHDWAHWFGRLDRAGAAKLNHRAMARKLGEMHPALTPWWRQMITVHFERARGLRVTHQKCDGSFSASASKMIRTPLAVIFEAWTDPGKRTRWLPDAPIRIRRAMPGKTLRLVWGGGLGEVDVQFSAKGPAKTQVALDHEGLPNLASVRRQKSFWRPALENLKNPSGELKLEVCGRRFAWRKFAGFPACHCQSCWNTTQPFRSP